MAEALAEERAQGQAVVVLSDGIQTVGGSQQVLETVRRAKALAAPVYTRTLGAAVREPRDRADRLGEDALEREPVGAGRDRVVQAVEHSAARIFRREARAQLAADALERVRGEAEQLVRERPVAGQIAVHVPRPLDQDGARPPRPRAAVGPELRAAALDAADGERVLEADVRDVDRRTHGDVAGHRDRDHDALDASPSLHRPSLPPRRAADLGDLGGRS